MYKCVETFDSVCRRHHNEAADDDDQAQAQNDNQRIEEKRSQSDANEASLAFHFRRLAFATKHRTAKGAASLRANSQRKQRPKQQQQLKVPPSLSCLLWFANDDVNNDNRRRRDQHAKLNWKQTRATSDAQSRMVVVACSLRVKLLLPSLPQILLTKRRPSSCALFSRCSLLSSLLQQCRKEANTNVDVNANVNANSKANANSNASSN